MNLSNKSLWFTGLAGGVLVFALAGFWVTYQASRVGEAEEHIEASHSWEGTYEFYEDASQPGGAPMFTAYDMNISKEGDTYALPLSINGHMQAEEIKATGIESNGKLVVTFDSYGEYRQPDRFTKGDELFVLSKASAGKLKIEWQELQPNFANTDKQNSFFELKKGGGSSTEIHVDDFGFTVEYPSDLQPDQNFAGFALTLPYRDSEGPYRVEAYANNDARVCLQVPTEPYFDKRTVEINSLPFETYYTSDVATGHTHTVTYYKIAHNSRCYMVTVTAERYDPSRLEGEERVKAEAAVKYFDDTSDAILRSFRFTE